MAAQAWKIYAAAKKKIGNGTIDLGSGIFKMSLHRNSASTTITSLSTITIFSSVAVEISARGGYKAVDGRCLRRLESGRSAHRHSNTSSPTRRRVWCSRHPGRP